MAFPELVHPEFDYADGGRSRSRSPSLGIGIAAYLWFQHEELGPFKGLTAAQQGSRTRATTFLVNKYYLDALYENVIVASIKGPIAARRVLGQPARDRRGRQRRRPGCAWPSGSSPTTSSTRRASTARSTKSAAITGESGGLLRYLQSGRVQRYALLLFAAVGLAEPLPATRQSPDPRGIVPMDWFDNWALTLAVFIPIVGMVIVLLIPKAEENLIKVVALLATVLTARGRHRDPRQLQPRRRPPAVRWPTSVDRRDPQPLPRGHRRHLAAAACSSPCWSRSAASSTRGTTSPSRTTRRRSSRSCSCSRRA